MWPAIKVSHMLEYGKSFFGIQKALPEPEGVLKEFPYSFFSVSHKVTAGKREDKVMFRKFKNLSSGSFSLK